MYNFEKNFSFSLKSAKFYYYCYIYISWRDTTDTSCNDRIIPRSSNVLIVSLSDLINDLLRRFLMAIIKQF